MLKKHNIVTILIAWTITIGIAHLLKETFNPGGYGYIIHGVCIKSSEINYAACILICGLFGGYFYFCHKETVLKIVDHILFKERQPWYFIISQGIFLLGLFFILMIIPTFFGSIEADPLHYGLSEPFHPLTDFDMMLWRFAANDLSIWFVVYLAIVWMCDVVYPAAVWGKNKVF